MLAGKTRSGFEFAIPDSRLDDMELLEALEDLEENPAAIVAVTRRLLGEQKKALYDHLRDEDGKVATSKVMQEIKDILETGNGKK